jgi:hypothetical protein
MSFRFVVFEDSTGPHDDQSFRTLERTHPPTFRTRLLLTQLAGLLLGRHFQGSRQQSTHGGHRDIFHLS